MVWLNLPPIAVGRRGVISSFKWFLPVFATRRGRGEGVCAFWERQVVVSLSLLGGGGVVRGLKGDLVREAVFPLRAGTGRGVSCCRQPHRLPTLDLPSPPLFPHVVFLLCGFNQFMRVPGDRSNLFSHQFFLFSLLYLQIFFQCFVFGSEIISVDGSHSYAGSYPYPKKSTWL